MHPTELAPDELQAIKTSPGYWELTLDNQGIALVAAYEALLRIPPSPWRIANGGIYCNLRDAITALTNESADTIQTYYESRA